MTWNRELLRLQVQIMRLQKKLYLCTITAAARFALLQTCLFFLGASYYVGYTTEWQEYSGIHLRLFGIKDGLYSNFEHIKTEKHGNFKMLSQSSKQLKSGKSVTIRNFQV